MAFSKQQEKEGVELAVKSDGWTDSGHQYHPDRDQPISYSQAKYAANMKNVKSVSQTEVPKVLRKTHK